MAIETPLFIEKLEKTSQYYFIRYFAFNAKMRLDIYKKLASYMITGFPLPEAINLLYQDASNDGKKPTNPNAYVLNIVRQKINNGIGFGEAISDWVPSIDATMLIAGEKGDISVALKDCVGVYQKKKAINGAIWAGVAGPCFLLILVFGFMLTFAWKIIPPFSDVYPMQKWTGLPKYVADTSLGIANNIPLIIGLLIGIFVIIMWSIPNWTGKLRVYFDNIPPWSLYRIYSGAGFMLVYASMTGVGFKPTEILDILGSTGSKWMKERMLGARKYVEDGKNIGDALILTELQFPDKKTVRDIRAYNKMEGFEENLRDVANEWIITAEENVKKNSNVLNKTMMLIMGAVIGAIVMSSTQLQQQISTAIMQDAH